MSRRLGTTTVLEVWNGATAHYAKDMVRRASAYGPVLFFAADQSLATAIGSVVNPSEHQVYLAPWGVLALDAPHEAVDPEGSIAAAILASGEDSRAMASVLEAFAKVAEDWPQLLLFADAEAARRSGVWAKAKQLGLLDRLSLVGNMEEHREPILHVDVIVQPEMSGAHHSLVLEAMAAGVLVVARNDPLVDYLVETRTCAVVRKLDPGDWAAAISTLLRDRARAEKLTASAREFVRTHHAASAQVRAVLAGYDKAIAMSPVAVEG
ncbi:MAG: glycosyltransferase [Phycisphaerales bacterium]|nr:glycosyltransferase [Phycisphaerales bacterium]